MDLQERITQFENMATADPDNDMAHFSLGNAYFQAERWADAAQSFQRCVQFNAAMSKAYQLGGEALIKAGDNDAAREFLTAGYLSAGSRGDQMPMQAMGELLQSIGAPVPEVQAPTQSAAAEGEGTFRCQRSGRMGTKLGRPPFRGPLGEYIQEHISAETWRDWIGQGTKVINELRLDLSREMDQRAYDSHMIEFLGLEQAVQEIEQSK